MNAPEANPRARISTQPIALHVTPRGGESLKGQRMRMLSVLFLDRKGSPICATLFSRN